MFPQYYDRRGVGDYLPDAGTPQEQHRRALPQGFAVVRYRPTGAEFVTLQLAAILSAAIVTLAIGESFGFLHIMGIAGIEYGCFVVAVQVVGAVRRRFLNGGSAIAPVGDGAARHQRERWWVFTAEAASYSLTCWAIASHVHPFISQLGALFLVAFMTADITMLVRRVRK